MGAKRRAEVVTAPQMPSVASKVVPSPRRHLPFVVLLLLALLAGCSQGSTTVSRQSPERGTSDAGSATDDGDLRWGTCEDQAAIVANLQCATLEVPLDPADPSGEQIELALARKQASGPAEERIGSLVFNPGGPGGSGIEFLAAASATLMPEELADRFDLVSFDPRGVGASSPVRCIDDATKDEQLTGDLSPDTEEELQRAIEDSLEFVEGCRTNAPELLEHMSTADVAADLDRIRAAVGDEQLSYVGFSYGTSIGSVYASLFPERVRALVLDGSVSPDATPEEEAIAQGRGFERTLRSFVEHCNADPECALAPDAAGALDRIRAELEQDPVEVEDPRGVRTMGPDLFELAVSSALYDTTVWGTAARAIADVRGGGAELLFALADRQIGRQPDGSYDNAVDARSMVNCADQEERPTVEEGRAAADRITAALPELGERFAWGLLSCLEWPEAANPLPEISAEGTPPILVVGTLGDPATPYEWSEEMTAALGSARLLTYEGDGHTAFLRGGPCVDDAVTAYLIDGTLPAEGTRCPAQEESVSFAGLRDEIVSQFVDVGLPQQVAECVVDGAIAEVGEVEFDRMVLTEDVDELQRIVQDHSVRCALGG
jgi:pimeloyl-ACP methyl ester carboxylesterase